MQVLIRCDLNVPLDGKKITDDTRIRASVPTVKYLLDNGARVAISSHLGRPKGGPEDKYSLAPAAQRLSELLGQEVKITKDCIGEETKAAVNALKNGQALLLENVRFYPEEEKNNKEFSKKLAAPFDLYVNDAFGTAHRPHASMLGTGFDVRASGFLLKKELAYFAKALDNPERPFLAILGGAKVADKIQLIGNLLDKVNEMIIGGGMAYTFLKVMKDMKVK